MSKPKAIDKFWQFKPANTVTNQPAELILYGEISSYTWWGDEITPKQFNDELNALGDVSEIVVRINSGGGDVFAAVTMYTRLKDHRAKITVKIDGWACSAATIIAMAGDVIQIPAAGEFMIHDPTMGIYGYFSAEDFIKLAEELNTTKNCIVNAYALKTGKSKEEISNLMSAVKWYTGDEAVADGFCDELMFGDVETEIQDSARIIVNTVSLNLERLPNVPTSVFKNRLPKNKGGFSNFNHNHNEGAKDMEIKNVDDLRTAYPEFTSQIADTAAAAERKRIQDIEGITLSGFDDIVNKAKFENPINAAEVALQIVAEQKKLGADYLEKVKNDVQNSGADGVKPGGHEGTGGKENPFDAAIDKVMPVIK